MTYTQTYTQYWGPEDTKPLHKIVSILQQDLESRCQYITNDKATAMTERLEALILAIKRLEDRAY